MRKPRVKWTDQERVAVFNAYLLEYSKDHNKRDALVRAYKVALPDPARWRDTFAVYTIIDDLAKFKLLNPKLFEEKEPTPEVSTRRVPMPMSAADHQNSVITQAVNSIVADALKKASNEADDRLQMILDLMTERLSRFEARMIEIMKTNTKRPKVLVVGCLDSQGASIIQRLPAYEIETIDGESLKSLSNKGRYDLVILWTKFASHSIEDVLREKYNNYVRAKPGAGISTIIEIIKENA